MKTTSTRIAATYVAIVVSLDAAMAFPAFLYEVPNGLMFGQTLGHISTTSFSLNSFGQDFKAAGTQWTTALCQMLYTGTLMTNGAAFGDPCCTWVVGGTPDFTITPWVTKPTIAAVCGTSAPVATTTAPPVATTTAPPMATTTAPPKATTTAPPTWTTAPPKTWTTAPPKATTTAPPTWTTAPPKATTTAPRTNRTSTPPMKTPKTTKPTTTRFRDESDD